MKSRSPSIRGTSPVNVFRILADRPSAWASPDVVTLIMAARSCFALPNACACGASYGSEIIARHYT